MREAVLVALLTLVVAAQAAPKPRIAICHFQGISEETGELQWKFKNLPEPAAFAHLNRHVSDVAVVPGEVVEARVNGTSVFLDDQCDEVPSEPVLP